MESFAALYNSTYPSIETGDERAGKQRQAIVSIALEKLCEDGCLADVYVAGGGDKGYDAAFG